jgi:hypothetical protein
MHLTRRQFTQTLTAAGAVLSLPKSLRAAGEPSKLTLSAPLTHSDWLLKPGIPAGAEGVKHMLDACKACGWFHVYWRVFDAGQATYASQLLRPGIHADEDNCFNPQTDADRAAWARFFPNQTKDRANQILEQFSHIDYAKFDSLQAAIDYGHSIGLKIHAWASINEDDHGWGFRSEFSKAHPEFRWVRRDGTPYHSQLSFAFPEVRAYKLGLVKELLAYDIDGLFLDWVRTGDIRDNPQTNPDGVANSGYEQPNIDAFKHKYGKDPHDVPNDDERWLRVRAEPQTMFMRELRKLIKNPPPLKGGARGGIATAPLRSIPIAVMVGHPWHYRGLLDPIAGNLKGLLLDVKTWAEEHLMDAAIAAGYYRPGGNAANAYHALAEETGGKTDLWYYAWVPQTVEEFNGQFKEAQSLGAKRILFWEADYIDDRAQAAALKKAMSAKSI